MPSDKSLGYYQMSLRDMTYNVQFSAIHPLQFLKSRSFFKVGENVGQRSTGASLITTIEFLFTDLGIELGINCGVDGGSQVGENST